MERPNRHDDRQLVRCLDCGTVYRLPLHQDVADACPQCGSVVWVALAPLKKLEDERRS